MRQQYLWRTTVKGLIGSVLALCLGACGEETASNTTNTPSNDSSQAGTELQPLENPITLEGHVINGYYQRAKVCADTNQNKQCDANERWTYSKQDGLYQLEVEADSASTVGIVAEIIPQFSFDQDKEVLADAAFTMSAPPTVTNVTPFTTLLDARVATGENLETAKNWLEGELNMSFNPTGDYVQTASSEGGNAVALKDIAKLSTALIAREWNSLDGTASQKFTQSLGKLSSLAASYASLVDNNTNGLSIPEIIDRSASLSGNQARVVRTYVDDIDSIDPREIGYETPENLLSDLFEPLVTMDYYGNPIPGLASSWAANDDCTEWTFTLRNAYWSNGDAVTADDVVFAWQRLATPPADYSNQYIVEYANVENLTAILDGTKNLDQLGVAKVDNETVHFSLSQPTCYLTELLTDAVFSPLHKASFASLSTHLDTSNLVSNGAYKLSSTPVDGYQLIRNENYWNNTETIIDTVDYLQVSSAVAATDDYQAGNAHIVPVKHSYPEYQELTGTRNEIKQIRHGSYFYRFNMAQPPFNDQNLRLALSIAADRQGIAPEVLGGTYPAAYAITSPNIAGYSPPFVDWSGLAQTERETLAKSLFAQAGYGPENPLSFELLYNATNSNSHQQIASHLKGRWTALFEDVEITLKSESWDDYLQRLEDGDFQLARSGWLPDYNEASASMTLMHSQHSLNSNGFNNQAFDNLIEAALSEPNNEARQLNYQQAQAILDESAPNIPLYDYLSSYLVKGDLRGFSTYKPVGYQYSKDLYFVDEESR